MRSPEQPFQRSAPRVLIVRTSAFGDIIQGLPVLEALRKLRPEATVGWAVESHFSELLLGHTGIDRLFLIRSKQWRQRPLATATLKGISLLRRDLLEFGADIALDLMSNTKAALLTVLSGAPIRVGLARAYRREPASSLFLNHAVEPLGAHAVERALSVLRPFGLERACAPLGGDQLQEGELPHRLPDRPFAVIHPGAGWRNKELPTRTWARVARGLSEQAGLRILVVTGPGEDDLGRSIEAQSERVARHLALPGLSPLVALHRRASLVLGGDTGPVHLARSLERPVVCVMGPTDPDRHGPWLAPSSTVVERLECSFCHKRLDSPRGCLVGLPAKTILEAAFRQLAKSTAPSDQTRSGQTRSI